ncbi:MAG: ATP-dependent DNA ligase [Candidatus Helarchaeota archaeon]
MRYGVLAKAYEELESTSKRLEMTDILVKLIKQTPVEILDKVIFLTQGKLHPSWLGLPVIGIAEKSAIKAVSLATGINIKIIDEKVKEIGDLGSAFEKFSTKKRQKTLISTPITVKRVYLTLDEIAQASGPGSADFKIRKLAGLLADVNKLEGKWILRTVLGKLRFGIADQTIMDALAIAFTGDKSSKPIIERGYNIHPNLGEIAKTLAKEGLSAIENMKIELFTPVRMMLAQRLSSIKEILEKLGGKCACEFKYDGERIQAHKSGKKVELYSRNLENATSQYPDVCELITQLKANETIVEGECVAINPESGELRPFQELMHRRRKYEIDDAIEKYPVCLFLFDILKKGKTNLIDFPYTERRKILENIVRENDHLKLATAIISDNVTEIEAFFNTSIESGCEGIIAKSIKNDSVYQAGARGWLWIKLKESYQSKMVDSIDVVVVGAYWGRGKRARTYGALLCAILDEKEQKYKTICKVGSGFTDENLAGFIEKFEKNKMDIKPSKVISIIKPEPDIWFEPKFVMEVIGDELTLSPTHTAGFNSIRQNSGLAIRFPRFLRWREDKSPADITTESEVIDMYNQQLKQISQ